MIGLENVILMIVIVNDTQGWKPLIWIGFHLSLATVGMMKNEIDSALDLRHLNFVIMTSTDQSEQIKSEWSHSKNRKQIDKDKQPSSTRAKCRGPEGYACS